MAECCVLIDFVLFNINKPDFLTLVDGKVEESAWAGKTSIMLLSVCLTLSMFPRIVFRAILSPLQNSTIVLLIRMWTRNPS